MQTLNARIIVVEDNATNAAIIRTILKDLVTDIDIYPTAMAGLAAIAEDCPELIIMDLNLPDMSGLEAMRLIRSAEGDQNAGRTPIIAATATASATEEDRGDCFAAGADDFLLKPIDAKKLRLIAASWIKGQSDKSTLIGRVGQ